MAVKSSELNTPERGMSVETRGPAAAKPHQAFRERLDLVKRVVPVDPAPHYMASYTDGWRAALEAAEKGGLEAARIRPMRLGPTGCGDCFKRGWLAALEMLEGKG